MSSQPGNDASSFRLQSSAIQTLAGCPLDTYLLQVSAILQDDSRLEVRDYLFLDGSRTYAYQWMDSDNRLRRRWDNAPHWPSISTAPHHSHLPDQEMAQPSTVTNLEDLIAFLQDWFAQ